MPAKIVELVDVQTFMGQEVLTVWHYLDADGVADVAVLVADYITDVLPLFKAFQSNQIQHTRVRTRVLYPVPALQVETDVVPVVVGQDPGEALSSFATFSVKYSLGATTVLSGPASSYIKRGGKHLPGPTEGELTSNGTAFDGGTNTAVAAFLAEAKDPGTDPWQLVVVHRPPAIAGVPQPVQRYAPVTGFSVPSPSTQNTRKVLRGRTS